MNDPNGLVYDSRHGMYHVFFQDHLAMTGGVGPVYGHFASRNLVHWTQLPVALWNDMPYDALGIYTGSATVVNGQVVQVYPGVCNRSNPSLWPTCTTGITLNLAYPADPNDPLLVHWKKAPINPIANDSQRDPSTAWKTASGEWRFTTYDTMLYASVDFRQWYRVGMQSGWNVGECPSFFPLPKTTPDASKAPTDIQGAPTHVHKYSNGWRDYMRLGTYEDGKPGHLGVWSPWQWQLFKNATQTVDIGDAYATKDLYDPILGRRIMWAWTAYAGPGQGVMSLPREITWNPELQQLVYAPLPELDLLRGSVLANVKQMILNKGEAERLGAWTDGEGRQVEVDVTFCLPDHDAAFGVSVMADSNLSNSGMLYFVQYRTGAAGLPRALEVGSVNLSISTLYSRWMPDTSLWCCGQYGETNVSSAKSCMALCSGDPRCAAWIHQPESPASPQGKCTKLEDLSNTAQTLWTPPIHSPGTTSGVRHPSIFLGAKRGTLLLSEHDKTLSLRVYVDQYISEAFWQQGRVVQTRRTDPTAEASIALHTTSTVTVDNAQVWQMKTIWVSPEKVLSTQVKNERPQRLF